MMPTIVPMLRSQIKQGLAQCSDKERIIFCRMYAPKEYFVDDPAWSFMYNIETLAKYNIDEVVNRMPSTKLTTALRQVERTLQKKRENDDSMEHRNE